jgi:hypothetical protein
MATKTKAPARRPRASTPPEHDRFADLASAHHTAAQTASGKTRMAHDQLSALYADAAHAAIYLLHTGGKFGDKSTDGQRRRADMRARLASLKVEIADVRKRLV